VREGAYIGGATTPQLAAIKLMLGLQFWPPLVRLCSVNSEQGKSGLVFNTNRGALHGKWIAIATQQLGHVPLSPICTLPRPESLKAVNSDR
jgi:hypothetical protein